MHFSKPIIFLIYRRPELTRQVFARIREAKPRQLFVVADGPKNEEDAEKCLNTRAVIEQVDWDCEVYKNYSDSNLGCRARVSSGITWAFSHVESAIILEDDCLPNLSFFRFCETLLEKYKDDERIMAVSGNNFQDGVLRNKYSYYFSKYPHCWGWATWRRAWQYWEFNPDKWTEFKTSNLLHSLCPMTRELKYWERIFDFVFYKGIPDTWDYIWTFSCWSQTGLTILPNVNLVSNIGFGKYATHTVQTINIANLPTYDIDEICHPPFVQVDCQADVYTFEKCFSPKIKFFDRLKQKYAKLKKNFLIVK